MSTQNFSFHIFPPPRFLGTNSYHEAGKNYLLFSIFLNEGVIFNFWNKTINPPLIVPDNNSDLVNLFKTAKKDDIFTTPLTNLQFKPDFLFFDDELLNGLLIKDTNKVKKTTKNQLLYPEFTFKVIKQSGFKKMKGYKPECKILEIEIEPLDLGIEGLPKITKIQFYFFPQDPPHISPANRQLNREKHEKLFLGAEGKEFTMKIKQLIFGDRQITKLGQSLVYDTLTFSLEGDIAEIKEAKSSNDNSPPPSKPEKNNNNLSNTNSNTLRTFLLVGGIIGGLILVVFLFYFCKKRKK